MSGLTEESLITLQEAAKDFGGSHVEIQFPFFAQDVGKRL
jgi:hypothetical protein